MFAICFVVPYFSGKRLLFVLRVPIFLKRACYFVWRCVFFWKVLAILFGAVYFSGCFLQRKEQAHELCKTYLKPILNLF
jgi:hypothetical protein